MEGSVPNKQQTAAQLTAQALRNSSAANVPVQVPANYPASPDVVVRGTNQLTAPAPSLLQTLSNGWNTFKQKAQLAGQAVMGHDPYAPQSVDQNFYRPGQDASSLGTGIQPPVVNARNRPLPGIPVLR